MKKISLFFAFLVFLPVCLMAQTKTLIKVSKKDSLLQRMTRLVVDIDDNADRLSVYVTNSLKSAKPLKQEQWGQIAAYLMTIDGKLDSMVHVPLRDSLEKKDRHNFDSEYQHFVVQAGLMSETLAPFQDYVQKDTLYTAQIELAEARIERFLTASGNFKLYLISLSKTDISSVDLLQQITALQRTTDSLILASTSAIHKMDSVQQAHFQGIEGKVSVVTGKTDSLKKKADTIKRALYRDTSDYSRSVMLSAYRDNVFGLIWFQRIGRAKPIIPGNYWGVELIFPTASPVTTSVGGFVLYGIRDDKILAEAGVGYLKSNISKEDIAWKAGMMYMPKKIGIGLSYSPLTSVCIQLALNLK